jgi:hypothetical protein
MHWHVLFQNGLWCFLDSALFRFIHVRVLPQSWFSKILGAIGVKLVFYAKLHVEKSFPEKIPPKNFQACQASS